MKQQKRRKSENQATWRQRYLDWLESGLKQSDYCRREGYHAGTFYNWCSYFRKQRKPSQAVTRRTALEFVPVEVSPAPQQYGTGFSLHIGAFTLRYSGAPSAEQLAQWVKALRSEAC